MLYTDIISGLPMRLHIFVMRLNVNDKFLKRFDTKTWSNLAPNGTSNATKLLRSDGANPIVQNYKHNLLFWETEAGWGLTNSGNY